LLDWHNHTIDRNTRSVPIGAKIAHHGIPAPHSCATTKIIVKSIEIAMSGLVAWATGYCKRFIWLTDQLGVVGCRRSPNLTELGISF
jgi:hypothetical protein